jgi:hypothetical protein
LPRVRRVLLEEAKAEGDVYGYAIPTLERLVKEDSSAGSVDTSANDRDRIVIDKERLYQHQILNVHFTSYEGRRERDIVNPNTSRRDIMCLIAPDTSDDEDASVEGAKAGKEADTSEEAGSAPKHRFCYGRLLGIYHVNVIYSGRGSLDRRPRRFDLLWVRWFEEIGGPNSWSDGQLDRLRFYPLHSPDAVGFLDPSHVLRACHLISRFSLGKVEGHAPEYSRIAKADEDWVEYLVNRWVYFHLFDARGPRLTQRNLVSSTET